jgi:hypothetical protein
MRHFLALSLVLLFAVSQAACNTNFVTELRIVLAASGPLVSSLEASGVLPASIGANVIQDFTDEANAVGDFSAALTACGTDNQCKANAAETLFNQSEAIYQRGHFGSNVKILTAANIARGIFESIKLYYASRAPNAKVSAVRTPTDKELKAKVQELKLAMQP